MSAANTVQDTEAIKVSSILATRLVWLDGEPFEMPGDWEVRGIHTLQPRAQAVPTSVQSAPMACLA